MLENLLILAGVFAVWIILNRYIFPRIGIQG